MKELLKQIYQEKADQVYEDINKLINEYKTNIKKQELNQTDSILITYGDSLLGNNNPLQELNSFLKEEVKDSINSVHLLPMFPYTSDDGFSVVDYLKINPDLGDWDDINELSKNYDLMFDAVINHISKSSDWFKGYSKGEDAYKDFFIECDPEKDYSNVVRPRSLPLYYPYETNEGTKHLWATFSEDQLDINYENPKVLIEVLRVLLEYAKNGAKYIRFDAIGFIWKKENTTCIHLDETHALVKLMRVVLDECYPNTRIISETNVPHKENITYFGNGFDEAHMVYQFPLPPLTLFSFLQGDASKLTKWAISLDETPLTEATTYFNFLASHDGIGMRPTEGILTNEEKEMMVQNTLNKGGRIGYKNNPDGSKSPYELNINYLDAVTSNDMSDTEKCQKFMATQSVLLSLQGVPGIYVHSLLGSRNDILGMEQSNINRRINREKLHVSDLKTQLKQDNSLRSLIFNEYKRLLDIRKEQVAFSPSSTQEVLQLSNQVFSVLRVNELANETMLVLINVTENEVTLDTKYQGTNILTGEAESKKISLAPYEYKWIKL